MREFEAHSDGAVRRWIEIHIHGGEMAETHDLVLVPQGGHEWKVFSCERATGESHYLGLVWRGICRRNDGVPTGKISRFAYFAMPGEE